MRVSDDCIWIIKEFEGFSAKPYLCPAKIWTIGFGHTEGITKNTPPITEEEAIELLIDDLDTSYAPEVENLVQVEITQSMFDALVSFHYNTGKLGTSTLLKCLNRGDYTGAVNEFGRWIRGGGKVLKGLVRRREAEVDLFLKDGIPDSL